MRIRLMALAGITLAALAGCKSNLSETTDEQLLQILGGDVWLFNAGDEGDRPAQIPRRMVECVEMLSGARAEIYKDMPGELAGMFKTECRKDLQNRLADPKRNTTGLELADFETAGMMERIDALEVRQAEALKAYEADKENARREKVKEQVKAAREEAGAQRKDLAARIERLTPICRELAAGREKLQKKNRFHDVFNKSLDLQCLLDHPFERELEHLDSYEKRLTEVEESDYGRGFFSASPPAINPENLDARAAEIEKDLAQVRAALAEQ